MISTMRPDIDNIDEYVRNTTARSVQKYFKTFLHSAVCINMEPFDLPMLLTFKISSSVKLGVLQSPQMWLLH